MARSTLVALTVLGLGVSGTAGTYVTCPEATPLCGLLTLESGLGGGVYGSLGVHGLWPEDGTFGTSIAVKPENPTFQGDAIAAGPAKIPGCTQWSDSWFANHEWTKHGMDAGSKDSVTFFTMACGLATDGPGGGPLGVISTAVTSSGRDWSKVQSILEQDSDYGKYVVGVDSAHDQIYFGACATCSGPDGKSAPCNWDLCQLTASPTPPHSPTPPAGPHPSGPTPAGATCMRDQHGPACASDADCSSVPDCVRCAGSGFCTDVPLEAIAMVRGQSSFSAVQ